MAEIGKRILELIKERGMTQKDFSERTGIPQSTISEWRRKELNPGADKILVICDVLKLSPQDLLSTDGNKKNSDIDYICIDKNSREYELIMEYRNLKAENKERLEGYLRALSES